MRNYLYSFCAHIVLILLLLYPFLNKPSKALDRDHVILVDFSKLKEDKEIEMVKEATRTPVETAPSKEPAKKQKTTIPKPAKKKPKTEVNETKVKEEVAELVSSREAKETQDSIGEKKAAEEEARKQREKNEKVAQFTSLLNQSKQSVEKSNTLTEETGQRKPHTGSDITKSPSNIQGSLGARRVLRVPTIKDDSQKRGRVVVKICVGPEGDVISADYTQIGSTTSDSYLIGLAEKGASEYLFSRSQNPRECGKVVIEFELK